MIRWREERRHWFSAVAIILVIMLTGGFARIVLGLALSAAQANAGAAVVVGALLLALVVRSIVVRSR